METRRLDPPRRPRAALGQSATEFVVMAPVLLLVILGALQLGLLYRAKSVLNMATFQAARIGSMHHGREDDMAAELANGLAALHATGTTWKDLMTARDRAKAAVRNRDHVHLTVVHPPEAYRAKRISNLRLRYLAGADGAEARDLNLLKIEVIYCHPLQVPLVSKVLRTLLSPAFEGIERQCLDDGRMPLSSTAVVRMNTDYCPQVCR